MDLQHIFNAGTFIRNTLKRALKWGDEDCNYGKRMLSRRYDPLQLQNFLKIFDNPLVKNFLKFDMCNLLADKYLIAMVFLYLNRARIPVSDYDTHHFFSALYLAHQMEEDDMTLRSKIVLWYPGNNLQLKRTSLHYFKNKIWIKMKFNCYVTKESCETLMRETTDWNLWGRQREQSHSGAFHLNEFKNTECKHCCKLYRHKFRESPDENNNGSDEDINFTTSDCEIDSDPDFDIETYE